MSEGMTQSDNLRKTLEGNVKNEISKEEDKQCKDAVLEIIPEIEREYGVVLSWEKTLYMKDIVKVLEERYPGVSFASPSSEKSYMSPDGGLTYLVDKCGRRYPILIAEVKRQGTNDKRNKEGKENQSLGNAIERLGKNVIGLRTYLMNEDIFPFVCFGDGCDFKEGSTILDRVLTIAMFGELNEIHTENETYTKDDKKYVFNRGSYFFREKAWTFAEIKERLKETVVLSLKYYKNKYGEDIFVLDEKERKIRDSYWHLLELYRLNYNNVMKKSVKQSTIDEHAERLESFFETHVLFSESIDKTSVDDSDIIEIYVNTVKELVDSNKDIEKDLISSLNNFTNYLYNSDNIDEDTYKRIKNIKKQ
ncbi:Restriction endonuclease EcoRI [Lachnospiraceae bacterium NE2001]|nr:Restriction endonuclease EcoRI [Lachnospiraceae bacterium NE2001]